MKARWLVPAIFFPSFFSFNTLATVYCVDLNSTNPVSPYADWNTAATNIQDAVSLAGLGDTVLVTNGIYQCGGGSFAGSNRVYVINNLTVQSVNGPAVTVIKGYQVPGTTNGVGAVRGVYLASGAVLSGFTVTGGATVNGNAPAGGIYCQSTTSVITNCVVTGNASASYAGGVWYGTLNNCILSQNIAAYDGGGSYHSWLNNCLLITNLANNGGGASYGNLTNCVLAGNSARSAGGGAYYAGNMNGCTIVGNYAGAGGGDYGNGTALQNCIIYYNSTGGGGTFGTNVYDFNLYMYSCCTTLLAGKGTGNITNPPAFVDLAGGNFRLQIGSPCINAGNNSFIANSTDLDGNPRIVNGTVDIGAYENQNTNMVHYVSLNSTNPVTPYTNWTMAATNIQDAIDAADAGDFIVVNDGVYNFGGRAVYGVATNRVTIDRAVTVQSVNGPTLAIIAGLPNTGGYPSSGIRCVYLTNGAALIGFTLTNGAVRTSGDVLKEQSGAAAWCESTNAILSNCALLHSYANRYGGGTYQGTLNNCTIAGNTAFISGGGTFQASLNNCIITGNKLVQGTGGGGAASGILNNCLITSNSAPGYGGGAYNATLNSCSLSNNSAQFGGGVCFGVVNNSLISSNRASQAGGGSYSNVLINCVLKNNFVNGNGGGAYNSALDNCTVVGNKAAFAPAAVAGGGVYGGSATNSIVYYNLADKGSNFSSNIAMNYCCTTPLPTNGPGNITNEPTFVNLAGGDLHLQSNSPCINSGNNTCVTSPADLDGNPRIAGGTVDMGAYEFQSPSSVLSYAWAQQYGLPTDGTADYADSDNDGMNNWQEWIAGTNPTNALSVLKMTSPAAANNPAGLVVTWQSASNITYFLQRSTNLGAQPAFSTIQSNIVGQTDTTSYTDTNAIDSGPYFYRVGVQH